MTLVGRNEDSSGVYEIHQEGAELITYTGSSPDELQELGVQLLRPVDAGSVEQDDAHWYEYGADGHRCGIYEGDGFARIDGITYELHGPPRHPRQRRGGRMFTQITRTGNLTKTPTLFRDQDGGKYTFASIACSRRFKDKASGEWQSGPRIVYDVHVTGNLAAAVVDLAQRCGNVALEFTGRLIEEADEAGTIRQKVYADNVTVSLRGQNVTVDRPKGKPRQGPDLAAEASSAWEEQAD